jgi:hypothetical protein
MYRKYRKDRSLRKARAGPAYTQTTADRILGDGLLSVQHERPAIREEREGGSPSR